MTATPLTDRTFYDPRDEPNRCIRKGYILYRPSFSDSERTKGLVAWSILSDGSEVSLWRHPKTVRLFEARGGMTGGTAWTGVNAWCAGLEQCILQEEASR